MDLENLRDCARKLPEQPGVYIMRNQSDDVIYVGKAKKLKNRVYQYFQDTSSHSFKTRAMVSNVARFEVIVTETEFEALVLECSLIKRYMPRYNILLKDDKGFPYLRINTKDPYPRIQMVSKKEDDSFEYFGPYGSRSATQNILKAIITALKLPSCEKKFPRDIGKGRPCLNLHMNLCEGWCQKDHSQKEYASVIEQAIQILRGNHKSVTSILRGKMNESADQLNFELAAYYRDRINAIENLGNKQLMVSNRQVDTDVIGFVTIGHKSCFAVLRFSNGNLVDKEYELLTVDDSDVVLPDLIKQYYLLKQSIPKNILLPFEIEDRDLIEQLFSQQSGRAVTLSVPQRGAKRQLVLLAQKNAQEEIVRISDMEERRNAALYQLGQMLGISTPARIESFDISNISGSDIVAGMTVFINGRPKKGEYKRFKIELDGVQDDYASMRQAVRRRFAHYQANDDGFSSLPDLLLIDGGQTHAGVATDELKSMEISLPVFGMVKDDRHRTRALVTPDGNEIGISGNQAVFSLIGTIQEETHNYAISYHRNLRSKRLRYSELDVIDGIGKVRKQELLRVFKSISAIKTATLMDLEQVLPKDAALSVYQHFQRKDR